MANRGFSTISLAGIVFGIVLPAGAQTALDWPRSIDAPKATIIMYQPQLESFEADQLKGRAAVSVTLKDKPDDRIFGAVWLNSRVSTDRDARTVRLLSVTVTDAKFPNATPEQIDKLKAILEKEIPTWTQELSLDHLQASLKALDKKKANAGKLNSQPPKILLSTEPAVLVVLDGQARLQKVTDSSLMRVVNTPYFIVLDMDAKTYYLSADNYWMKADKIDGDWKPTTSVPKVAVALADSKDPAGQSGQAEVPAPPATEVVPKVIIATEPTELIVTEGQSEFQTIGGTNLLYVSNTDRDVFLDIDNQKIYLLLSGRWYVAPKIEGPWEYIASKDLPADFAKISPDGPKGDVRASIAGTDEAKDAIAESFIPQTAAVKRSEAKLTVTYDGDPKFEAITGTSMQYAINTADSVIKCGEKYYCCSDAVWFESTDATGPWTICTKVPQEIYTIPPECPVYPVQYVYVYDSTPEVVYCGYTPGYEGCYINDGCCVYGTGYYYQPWVGAFYYPRPVTWGFGFYYNSASGRWGIVVDHNGNWFAHTGWWHGGYVTGGWWGHGGFCGNNINFNRNININNTNINNIRNKTNNIYNRRNDIDNLRPQRNDNHPNKLEPARDNVDHPKADNLKQNRDNLFSDKDGNVYRKDLDGWKPADRKEAGGEHPKPDVKPPVEPKPDIKPPVQPKPDVQRDLNRDLQVRNQGNQRATQYQQPTRSAPQRSFSGGGGGGRRR